MRRGFVGILAVALLAGACGGPSANATPTPGITLNLPTPGRSGSVIGPASPAATAGPGATAGSPGGGPSGTPRADRSPYPPDQPFHSAPDLEATLPVNFRGVPLTVESLDGTGFKGTRPHRAGLRCRFYPTRGVRCRDQRQLETAVGRLGKTLADVTIGVSYDRTRGSLVEVQALRVAGTTGLLIVDAVLSVLSEEAQGRGRPFNAAEVSIGGRRAFVVTEANAYPLGLQRWYYPAPSALYEIRKVDEATAAEVIALLP